MSYTPSQSEVDKLENNFKYHAPIQDKNQSERYERIRFAAKSYASFLLVVCPPSRELSLALTNLEQAVFWANAAIARNEK